jgi:hypothetical protein
VRPPIGINAPFTVLGLTNHLQVRSGPEDHPEAASNEGLVVTDPHSGSANDWLRADRELTGRAASSAMAGTGGGLILGLMTYTTLKFLHVLLATRGRVQRLLRDPDADGR